MSMAFKHTFTKTFSTTLTRGVGAQGVGRTLADAVGPFIHVAANGSDSNDGTTPALSVLTLGQAIIELGVSGRSTIMIIRNAFVGAITIDSSSTASSITLPSGNDLQVELNEFATISFTNAILLAGSNIVTGGRYLRDADIYPIGVSLQGQGTNITVRNIDYVQINRVTAALAGGISFNLNSAGFVVEYCFINSDVGVSAKIVDSTINNNIMIATPPLDAEDTSRTAGILYSDLSGASPFTIDVKRNIVYGFSDSIEVIYNQGIFPPAPGHTFNFDSNVFAASILSLLIIRMGNTAGTPIASYNFDFNLATNSVVELSIDPAASSSAQTVITTNAIDKDTPLMLVDVDDLVNNNNIDAGRLQFEGKTTLDGSGKYFIDSPLVGAGLSGVDVSPFDESTSLTSQSFAKTFEVPFPPTSLALLNSQINPIDINDVNGNKHIDYDGQKRRFEFTFGDEIHIDNLTLKEIKLMVSKISVKAFYPLGVGGNLFAEGQLSSGTFNSNDNSITIVGGAMITDYWRGFWVNIAGSEFFIDSNTETKLILVDKKADGFPSAGVVSFIIEFILVQNDPGGQLFNQQNFTQFKKGGQLREDSETVRAYDYTTDTLILNEVEDFEEEPE